MAGYNYDAQAAGIARKRKLAEALMQTKGPDPNQMAGGMVVKNSLLSNLAPVLQAGMGAYAMNKADKAESALKADQNAKIGEWLMNRPGADPVQPVMPSTGFSDPTRQQGYKDARAATDEVDQQKKIGWALQGQQFGGMGAAIGGKVLETQLFPKAPEEYTLSPGQKRMSGQRVIAESAAQPEAATPFERQLQAAGYKPGTPEYQQELKKYLQKQSTHTPPPSTNVTLNTEKSLYSTMADAQGKENVSMYSQAQKAPELLERAQRVKKVLSEGNPITGAGANQLLAGAKIAAQFGFNTGDAAADTEALGRDLAASTLDMVKASGLGAGSGFSNADRVFLEKAVGGTITLEAATLARLADLNERVALKTIERWNAQAGRLDPTQLKSLGMSPIDMPSGTAAPSARPKLQKNPDGSYNYSP